jgi:hypothetical protein
VLLQLTTNTLDVTIQALQDAKKKVEALTGMGLGGSVNAYAQVCNIKRAMGLEKEAVAKR